MLLPLPKRERDVEENILPLINIVFLLLIFFMLAGSMHTRAPFEVSPPDTANAVESNPDSDLLAVGADGELALGGTVLDDAGLRERLSQREADRPLQIKAHADVPAARLSELLALARDAGIARVRLLTVHGTS